MSVEPSAKLAVKDGTMLRSTAIKAEKSLVLVKSKQDTESLISDLQSNPNVEFAEPNYYVKAYGVNEPDKNKNPGYKYQWALKNQLNAGNANILSADANVEGAWNSIELSKTPVVAVLDSGVDYNHPDLQNIMWSDGLKHDSLAALGGGEHGYNAIPSESSNDPMDKDIGHGTHCAGIIGAQWNNNEGVVGVSPKVQIMAVRFLGMTGGDTAGSLRGYAYIQAAAEAGVNVVAVNNSWGPSSYNGRQIRSVSTAATAIEKKYGVVSCFAAGNDNVSNDHNTGSIVDSPYIVTVGAMDSQGYKSFFSSYGQETVDVFAPGSQILSTVSTYTDEALPMNEHTMPVQYLPQIQAAEDSYFYEDFEDESNIQLRLLNEEGKVVETNSIDLSPGHASSTGLQLSLDNITNGQNFSIEIVINRNYLENLDTSKAFHIAFQAGFDNAMYGQTLIMQYQDKAGQWQAFDSTQVLTKDPNNNPIQYLPARLRVSDHNWNQSSQEVMLPDFAEYVDPNANDAVVLRLIPEPTVDGQPTTMSGKDDSQPSVFRLDDLGFGKKASSYYYSDGTSMATPMVTGIAALLSTKYDTPEELCARIKGGVNRNVQASLENASVSNGYIDAGAAFDDEQCVPVLNDLNIEGNTATLTGYFFGAQGSLTVGGQETSIIEWNTDKIRFTLPVGAEGKQEISVHPSGKDYGRDVFIITPDTVNYTTLAAPDLELGESNGYALRSADLQPLTMAATDSKIAYLGFLMETNAIYMSIYDIASDKWQNDPVELPENLLGPGNLTAGKTKFYLLYSAQDPNTEHPEVTTVRIGTYDPISDIWTSVDSELSGSETLVVYEDKLLAIGGEESMEDGMSAAKKTVLIVDPETGKIIGNLPDMPDGRSGVLTGVSVSASGKTLMVHGGHNGFLNPNLKLYTNTISYDGEKWTSYSDNFPNAENLDPNQTINPAYTALNNSQMIAVGPVKNLGSEDMLDTWHFIPRDNAWSGDTNKLYSQTKTTQNIGTASGDQFYVLGYTGRNEESLVFRSTTVDYTGPIGDPSVEQPAPPEPNPSVSPTSAVASTDSSVTGTGANAGTGLLNSSSEIILTVAALLFLTVIGGVIFLRKKKG